MYTINRHVEIYMFIHCVLYMYMYNVHVPSVITVMYLNVVPSAGVNACSDYVHVCTCIIMHVHVYIHVHVHVYLY